MTDNVVPFAKPDDRRLIWVCNCGCTTHYHHADGSVECGNCGYQPAMTTGTWREHCPMTEADIPQLDTESFKVVDLDAVGPFLRRTIKADAMSPLAAVLAVHLDGAVSRWFILQDWTAERNEWLRRRIDKALATKEEPCKTDPK